MDSGDFKNLKRLVKKTSSYKPKQPPKKPDHQPDKKELETNYKLNLKSLKIKED